MYRVDRNVPIRAGEANGPGTIACSSLHPAWIAFIRFCRELQHGEIDQLKIQDGLPQIAETVKQKVKFTK